MRDMVGRALKDQFPPRDVMIGETLLDLRNWTAFHPIHDGRKVVDDVSFSVRAGEIVGIAGLMGAGRTELAMSIFGRSYGSRISGEVLIRGRPVDVSSVPKAIRAGLCYATEDRKTYGLVLINDIRQNIPLANLKGVANGLVVDSRREREVAQSYRTRMSIKSSGNRPEDGQSVGRQPAEGRAEQNGSTPKPDILILDEPTRGIDVGAKYEIYTIINELAAAGKAVVMISSEMPELLGMSDRIYVMNEGRFVGELAAAEASQERIMGMIVRNRPLGDPACQSRAAEETGPATWLTLPNPAPSTRKSLRWPICAPTSANTASSFALIAIMLFFTISTDGILLRPTNLTNLVLQNSYIVIMAVGMLMVIVCGHIDLSVGSVMGFIGALSAVLIVQWGIPYPIAALICLVVGAAIVRPRAYWIALLAHSPLPSS